MLLDAVLKSTQIVYQLSDSLLFKKTCTKSLYYVLLSSNHQFVCVSALAFQIQTIMNLMCFTVKVTDHIKPAHILFRIIF